EQAFHEQQIRVLEGCYNDSGCLDMEKVTVNIWRHRRNPDLVEGIIDLISKNSDERAVFNGVEFYLPQLAHMVTHLGGDFPLQSLQAFMLSVVQQSMHFALQLHWIIVAMMQDYAPEDPQGLPNKEFDLVLYMRAVRLLQTVDRCVISASARRVHFEELWRKGGLSEAELRELEIADRRFLANGMLRHLENDHTFHSGPPAPGEKGGILLFKRWERLKRHTHPWKPCYFKIQERTLFCYRGRCDRLKRAIPLEDAQVTKKQHPKKPFYFTLTSYYGNMNLAAESQRDLDEWLQALNDAITLPPKPLVESTGAGPEAQITKVQEHKWAFFQRQRGMVRRLTDIVEELRFLEDVPARKPRFEAALMELPLPAPGYVPMCRSTDAWAELLRVCPGEAKCFKSKARVPGLVTFEVARGADDVASHLHRLFEVGQHGEGDEFGAKTSRDVSAAFGAGEEKEEEAAAPPGKLSGLARRLFAATPGKEEASRGAAGTGGGGGGGGGDAPRRGSIFRGLSKRGGVFHGGEGGGGRRQSSFQLSHFRWPSMSLAERVRRKQEERRHRGSGGGDAAALDTISEDGVVFDELREPTAKLGTSGAAATFGESWVERVARIQSTSPLGQTPGWQLRQIIAKSNDDVRQEVFIMQLFQFYKDTFRAEGLRLWLRPYQILSTSNTTGLIEVVTDTTSFDGLKKMDGFPGSLLAHFEKTYGPQGSPGFRAAQDNYIESLAAYSIVCWLLGIKDRHNGNIMLDTAGHVIHIDYGFVFGSAPGNQFSMERAPFKLTVEMAAVMGGPGAPGYRRFVDLCAAALAAARAHREVVEAMLEIMMHRSRLPFAAHGERVLRGFRARLLPGVPDAKLRAAVERRLVGKSYDHAGANLYDRFQVLTNGIAK
ncbi:unnamed protein product, partial [Heterosigma akashiwo]